MRRRSILVSGIVQGVGFRPFVFKLASQLNLCGFVRNRAGNVLIEVEGAETQLDLFLEQLTHRAPPLADIDKISWQRIPACDDNHFQIFESESAPHATVLISPDVSMCDDCRDELFNPSDRRYRYPFLNCTNCGPRLTIIRAAPYDRLNTTMSGYQMCKRCRREYDDPADRRFHAQPNACPECGPQLRLLDPSGQPVATQNPLAKFCDTIAAGQIGAMKGLGGYHLICLASNDQAVAELRRRKHRYEKPLAIMVRDSNAAAKLCKFDHGERSLLESSRRPIVLLRKRTQTQQVSDAVAPQMPMLGVMLPYTPLHELLLDSVGNEPLVMTSGNRSDEPIAYDDADAVARLTGIADQFLVHDRPIHIRCDDSVTRIIDGAESPLRRSRGYAPQSIRLPMQPDLPILAVGGQLKGAFALVRETVDDCATALLSHHMGDLDHLDALEAFRRDIDLYQQLFDIQPQVIACDSHPDYGSTTYAVDRAERESIRLIRVQHHHAHLASCMVEHQLDGDVIGVIFDGSGLGSDNTIWGGEFLVGGYASVERAGHLRPVRLPGGDQATKEPWRMAVSHMIDAGLDAEFERDQISNDAIRVVRQMIERGFHSPWTSSVGRLFDAVAAIIGLRHRVSYEAQAAIELESLAMEADSDESYRLECLDQSGTSHPFQIDTRALIRCVVEDRERRVATNMIARRFHLSLAEMVQDSCRRIRGTSGLNRVVLSGGVFMNASLSEMAAARLQQSQFEVFRHHVVPPGDGGLCLGQLAIAAHVSHV